MATVEKINADSLFVSEPDPTWFGNTHNPKSNPSWTNKNWLKSRFHFSFAEYRDRDRANFGVLRVMNDDLVQPDRGFGTHPHNNMEICTYVVEGLLTHKDSMGTKETLGRGSIQFMTAGTGVRHSEFNESKDKPLRFIQMWINPRSHGLPPNYGSLSGAGDQQAAARRDQWAHLVSDAANGDVETPVKINQDANIYVTELSPGKAIELSVSSNRQAYFLCIEGAATIKGHASSSEPVATHAHDAARINGADAPLTVEAGDSGAHLLVVEMAKSSREV